VRDDSGLRASPELEAMCAQAFQQVADAMTAAGKASLYSNLSRVSLAGSYAVSFIEDQARNPCPHGGADESCECYPHRARRWLASNKRDER